MNNYELSQILKHIGYESETGRLFWKCGHGFKAGGSDCGGAYKGRVTVHLNGGRLKGENVAWLIHHRAWPSSKVVFKDGDRLNLKASNLCLDARKQTGAPASGSMMIRRVGDRFEIQDNMSYPPRLVSCGDADELMLAVAAIAI